MICRSVATIVCPLLLAAVMVVQTTAQKTPESASERAKSCPGLHAGISAQLMSLYIETPAVMLSFVLLNDSETPVDVEVRSWRIVEVE
jgi:hypothetical protein